MDILIALLFHATHACTSDADFNCHRPAAVSSQTIIYLFDSENPVMLIGKDFK